MRRTCLSLVAAGVAAAAAWVQAGANVPLTFKGAPNTPTFVDRSLDGGKTYMPMSLGSTDAAGTISLTPTQIGFLSGKPMINIRFQICPNQNTIGLFPGVPAADADEANCQQGCECRHRKGAFAWGSTYVGTAMFPALGQSFFFDNPLSFVVIGGAAAGGIIAATAGGGDNGTTTPSGGETRSETDVVVHTFSGMFQAATNSCNFQSSNGSVAFSGTMPSTTAIFAESNGTTISNIMSAVTQNATNKTFFFQGTGVGTIPGLGSYQSLAQINFTTGNGITGTLTLTLVCGQVVLTITATR